MTAQTGDSRFWRWFVIAPLVIVVLVSIVTVSIAIKNSDDVVVDNYDKQGRMINQTLEQDKRAQELGLTAEVMFDRYRNKIVVNFKSDIIDLNQLPKDLLLYMGHPVKAEQDLMFQLVRTTPNNYVADLTTRPEFSWYLTLYASKDWALRDQAEWTLSGTVEFPVGNVNTVKLSPRISP